MEPCPHLHPPTPTALQSLRNPTLWCCRVCSSTDGVWCCLSCGHIGCGRRAHMPALGGGHSRHHYQMMAARIGSGREMRCDDGGSRSGSGECHELRHEVCIDIVSRAVHCYACDDYVISDVPWLDQLRKELMELETREELPESDAAEGAETDMDTSGGTEGDGIDAKMQDVAPQSFLPSPATTAAVAAALPSPYPPSPIPTRRSPRLGQPLPPPGCTGLRNLGNTCYMNSVLQSLSHCTGFRSFFNDFLRASAPLRLGQSLDNNNVVVGNSNSDMMIDGGNNDNNNAPLGIAQPMVNLERKTTVRHLLQLQNSEEEPERLALTEEIHSLLRVLWSGRWDAVSPKSFVHAVWTHGGLFAARRQQDASEFLGFVLDRLDEELKPLNNASGSSGEGGGNGTKKNIWPGTVLTDLFGIEQRQEVVCEGCQTKTIRTEPLLGLYLSLPPQDGRRRPVTLEECLEFLTASERLTGDNIFHCDKCEADRDATKTVALARRPQTLLFSFRRTMWTKARGLHKDSRRVVFPLDLDATSLLHAADTNSNANANDEEEECHYRLAAIVSHSGSSPLHGHYFAFCRVTAWSHVASVADLRHSISDNSEWYLFNDSTVSKAEESEVMNAEAFILLYDRRQGPVDGDDGDVKMLGG